MSISSEITRINTNISNAYTAVGNKGGTLPVTQNSANLATAISSITTGGGSSIPVQEKDINFYDYDGTLLHSYTLAEVQELTELPELPTQQGLTCQGWNWTLADLKAEGKPTDVGAVYITDDGKTRLYIHIATDTRMNVPLCLKVSSGGSVDVNWGDGSDVENFPGNDFNNILPTHQYRTIGDYVITLNPIGNCTLTLGGNSNSYCIMGNTQESNKVYQNMLTNVEVGNKVSYIDAYAFYNCCSLSKITIPNNVTKITSSAFYYCYSLSKIIVPSGVTSIGSSAFYYCSSLSKISIPSSVTSISNNAFAYCCSLSKISIPNSITSITDSLFSNCQSLSKIVISNNITIFGSAPFSNCYSLSKISIPSGITTLNSTFSNCQSLSKIIIPSSVTSISGSAFAYCYGVGIYDLSNHNSVPTLSSSRAFNGIPSDCKIIVPDSLYNDWISASNWSNFSSYIVKASEV